MKSIDRELKEFCVLVLVYYRKFASELPLIKPPGTIILVESHRLFFPKSFNWHVALLCFGRGVLQRGMRNGFPRVTARSSLGSSPLQGSQEVLVRSKVTSHVYARVQGPMCGSRDIAAF